MMDDQTGAASSFLPPYTHDHHAARARLAAAAGVVLEQYVQARSRGALHCCKIRYVLHGQDGAPLWLLDDLDASHPFERVVVPVRNVRQCSGLDGRCTCAGEQDATTRASASASAQALGGVAGSPAGEVTCK